MASTDTLRYFHYTDPDGTWHIAENLFYDSDGTATIGRPIDTPTLTFDSTEPGSLAILASRPKFWPKAASWPPKTAWDPFEVCQKTQRECILCNSKTACACQPNTYVESQGDWTDSYFLHNEGDGRGVCTYSKADIKMRKVLGLYTGRVMFMEREEPSSACDYDMAMWGHHQSSNPAMCWVRAQREGNWTRFMAHSCEPNCRFVPVRIGRYLVAGVRLVRNVKAGDELTVNYGSKYFDGGMDCLCGKRTCIRFRKGDSSGAEDAVVKPRFCITTREEFTADGEVRIMLRLRREEPTS